MPQQLDLLPPVGLNVVPRTDPRGPRLWVRRLVVWRSPTEVLREIELRPGLNIVWSPDPVDQEPDEADVVLGHGSGKTLLCRLLRFCLGEPRFAPDGQRQLIAEAVPEGFVGAELVVEVSPWAVIRSIGDRRRHLAVRGGDLDALIAGQEPSTGIGPLVDAITEGVITNPVADLILGSHEHQAWLTALAWLTRDQECRFGDVLGWRDASSGSDSPVRDRDLSRADLLDALRAFLGAFTPADRRSRDDIASLNTARDRVERELRHLDWDARRRRARLIEATGLVEQDVPPGALGVEHLRRVARAHFAQAARGGDLPAPHELSAARHELHGLENDRRELASGIASSRAEIPLHHRLIGQIESELPGMAFALHEAGHPTCPVCDVPIDRALAEGCGLSHRLPDLDQVHARRDDRLRELDELRARREELVELQRALEDKLAAVDGRIEALRDRVRAMESARDAHGDAWFEARRMVDDVERLEEANNARDRAGEELLANGRGIEQARANAALLRDAQGTLFARLSGLFAAVVKELAGPSADGSVRLTGRELELTIQMGGDRTTAAIDSLKVLAFDLAAMLLSMEGRTSVPAFLLHDSPREADLGLSAYYALFRLIQGLESIGGKPQFQYIITTTTPPPVELRQEPWLRLVLHGAPAERRLLRRDL